MGQVGSAAPLAAAAARAALAGDGAAKAPDAPVIAFNSRRVYSLPEKISDGALQARGVALPPLSLDNINIRRLCSAAAVLHLQARNVAEA